MHVGITHISFTQEVLRTGFWESQDARWMLPYASCATTLLEALSAAGENCNQGWSAAEQHRLQLQRLLSKHLQGSHHRLLHASCSPGKDRALPDGEGQPDGTFAPIHLLGQQARVVGFSIHCQ